MNRKFPNLCSPLEVGNLVLKNRMVAAPMSHPNISADGLITPEMTAFYELRARGGVSVVTVSEAITHIKTGKSHSRHINLEADYVIMGLAATARAIRRHGAVASMELSHSGYKANVDAKDADNSKLLKYGPSHQIMPDGREVFEMPKDVIREIVESYGRGAALCKSAGFEMIMVHGGHGWLLNQFLSPFTNKRTDEYGGSTENRARLAMEILDCVRDAVGPRFPIEFRISAVEYNNGGYDLSESVKFAKLLESKIDLLHVSTGNLADGSRRTHPTIFEDRGCNIEYAAKMKKHVSIPVVTVGAISDPHMMEETLISGRADVIAMGRALLADSYLPRKVLLGKDEDITPCIRCLTCYAVRKETKSRLCAVNPEIGEELEYRENNPVANPKKVIVAGGGPGGMEAAITAAKRGHKVILCEKSGEFGGALKCEKDIPFKSDIFKLIDSKALELKKSGAEIRLNTTVTAEYVNAEAPDVLIVAIGAEPFIPPLEGIGGPNVKTAEDAMADINALGNKVAILGGGLVGSELAIYLAGAGKQVAIAEMYDALALNANAMQQTAVTQEINDDKNISVYLGMTGVRVTGEGLVCADKSGKETLLAADTVVCAVGRKNLYGEAKTMLDSAPEVMLVGDCVKPDNIIAAISRGYHAALDI